MAFFHEEDDHTYTDEKKEYGAEDRYSSKPQKAHFTGEFVIVAKFGGHALRHLASRLANVVGRQTKNLVFAKIRTQASIIVALFYALYLGGNFRGAHHFWGDLYLNSTTILFDSSSCYIRQVLGKFVILQAIWII